MFCPSCTHDINSHGDEGHPKFIGCEVAGCECTLPLNAASDLLHATCSQPNDTDGEHDHAACLDALED